MSAAMTARTARSMAWKTLKWLLIGLLGLVLMTVVANVALRNQEAWLGMSQMLRAARPALIVLQLAVIAVLWWRWHSVMVWAHHKKWVSATALPTALSVRHRVIVLLLICELSMVIRPLSWL